MATSSVVEWSAFQRSMAAVLRRTERAARAEGCLLTALATRRASAFYQALGYTADADYFRKTL
jgi:hypothetical protein